MNTIQEGWESYLRAVAPKDASTLQRVETQRAFYAGAAGVLAIVWKLGKADISQAAGSAIMEGLQQEAFEFISQVEKGRACNGT